MCIRDRPHSLVTDLYGQMSLPVISAPMFIVSNPKLVVAQCTSGIVGSFPALNARPQSLLTDWLDEILSLIHIFQDRRASLHRRLYGLSYRRRRPVSYTHLDVYKRQMKASMSSGSATPPACPSRARSIT